MKLRAGEPGEDLGNGIDRLQGRRVTGRDVGVRSEIFARLLKLGDKTGQLLAACRGLQLCPPVRPAAGEILPVESGE